MNSLEYQKKLAEYDEKMAFHKMKMDQFEHEKSLFVLSVLDATMKDRIEKKKEIKENAG